MAVKQRFIRVGDEIADEVTIVVRGGALDAAQLREDALRNHAIYATYGISVLAARDATVDELAQQTPLIRFEYLTLMSAGTLRSAGFRLEATGRNPRHFDITLDDLAEGINRLVRCEHRTIVNPYHEE